ncbi:unnamed protein product [Penicillium bialowiezense]
MSATEMPLFLRFVRSSEIGPALAKNSKYPTSSDLNRYRELWMELVAHRVPSVHLVYLFAIVTLQALLEDCMGFSFCDKIVALKDYDQIDALRDALPSLPHSLVFVLAAYKKIDTCAVTLIPAMPPVLDSLLQATPDMATKIRLFLRDSECIVDSAIWLDSKIGRRRMNRLKREHPGMADLFSELNMVQLYGPWFATRNALNFAEGLKMFEDAVMRMEENSSLKTTYIRFLHHFQTVAMDRSE